MKKLLLSIILVTGWVRYMQAQHLSDAVTKNGSLRVVDSHIVNQHGQQPQLRGISMSWSIWGGRKYYNTDVQNWLVTDFKITLLRVAMAVEPEHGYLQEPVAQTKLVTEQVDQAIKNGIYVLIDWHDHHAWKNVDQSKAFFSRMAKRYKGKPNVIYEVWNEPERIGWDTIKNYATQVITEIRKYDRNNLIIVGSPHWDQDVDVAAADPITGFKNIAYSFHFYATEPSHQDGLRAKAEKAMQLGLPLMVTEWGVGEADGNGEFNREKTAKWMDWLNKYQLSWANWNVVDKQETTALLQPGAPTKGHWTEDQLTPAGLYIREQLRKLNK
ncbi:glycoside hydrolase family 5 protein [Mucilaginibacter robiniae]|uniref:Glycoside hydrolase family 5 protein n=1 Tax=Mucilaginibacter robiniae TaxID=2728022 RepID=A0A7L5E2D0_9SPHI|nr:glycoside hydrolase family 5 protein [Mucilaginibacter robiniae]QJD95774.1 glycoside hydrolase family 5 protein [Mucilaginibacter robiniae]